MSWLPSRLSTRLSCWCLAMLCVVLSLPGRAAGLGSAAGEADFRLGVDVLLDDPALLRGKRVGLVTNATGVDGQLRSDIDRFAARTDFNLVALFGPEHGVRGDAQAGEHVDSRRDAATGLPVYSLYGDHREPSPQMLSGIDVLVYDIQDVGTRWYTYPWTLAHLLIAARRAGIPVVVADRPNPLGGEAVEGPVLMPQVASFVGMYAIPVRHGMTIGELARLFNEAFGIGADLHVVKMRGWQRGDGFPATLAWVPPSPNMPTVATARVYTGTGLLEGTNVSEGRGTTLPFEMLGAPFVDAPTLARALEALQLPGVRFRPVWFTPTFSKFQGQACAGVQLHVTDAQAFRPVLTGVAVIKALHDLYPAQFQFLPGTPPFFDKLIGNDWLRPDIAEGEDLQALQDRWQPDLARFKVLRARYLLY